MATDISALEAYAGQLSEAALKSQAAAQLQHEYIHGGKTADVTTESGALPTLAKQAAQSQEKVTEVLIDVASQITGSGTYPTIERGLQKTVNGAYFSVPSVANKEYLILYENVSGTAVERKKYPSTTALNKTVRSFKTVPLMLVELEADAEVRAVVTHDPVPGNNGWYEKVGESGTGGWRWVDNQPATSSELNGLRKQVSPQKRPSDKNSFNAPLTFGVAGAQILFGVHQIVPSGPSQTKGAVPMVGDTPILPMRTMLRPSSENFPDTEVLIMSGDSVMMESGGSGTPVIPVVTYDAKLISEQNKSPVAKRYALISGGQVWAYGPATSAQITQTGTWLAAQAVSFDIIKALKVNPTDAAKPQPHSIFRDGRIFRDGQVLFHKLYTGQSLALGSRGIVPNLAGEYTIGGVKGNLFSPAAPVGYADKLWTLSGGPRPSNWEGTTAFDPTREYVSGVLGETQATTYMLETRKWHERETSVLPQLICSISAVGGTAYSGLKKGTPTYTNALSQITTAKDIAGRMNLDYVVPSISIVHGESQSNTTRAEYVAYQLEWGNDYRTDIPAITGQLIPPLVFISQMLTGDPGVAMAGIPLAQTDVCESTEWFIMVGPKYNEPYFDKYHMLAPGYMNMAGREARAERLTQVSGKWQPLKVLSAAVSGAVITLKLNNLPSGNAGTPGPIGKLVADTALVSDPGNLGFALSSGTISSVVVGVDGASIVITAAAPIAAGTTLTYALQPTLEEPQNGNGRRGCIRDTDLRDLSRFDGKPIYNWLCAFSKNLEL